MAAASAIMHSSGAIASPMTHVLNKATITNQMAHVSYNCHSLLRSQPQRIRTPSLRVRCSTEGGQKEELSTPSSAPIPPPQSTPPSPPKVSTKFGDILAFSGPGPERINGRLAMVGFVGAMAAELTSGQDVITQISNGGVPWFLGTSVLFTLASLIPLFKGVSVQSKSDGIMTSDAELWNGRFAMLGLVALAFTEYVKHGALV